MRYWLSDAGKEIEAALHRLHCRIFDDDEWDYEDYAWLYGPFVAFVAYEVLILFIAGILN